MTTLYSIDGELYNIDNIEEAIQEVYENSTPNELSEGLCIWSGEFEEVKFSYFANPWLMLDQVDDQVWSECGEEGFCSVTERLSPLELKEWSDMVKQWFDSHLRETVYLPVKGGDFREIWLTPEEVLSVVEV